MPIEIERKFLVCNDEWRADAIGPHAIVQGYFCRDDRLVGRARLIGGQGYIAIKERKTGISRLEFEYEIPHRDAEDMIDLFCKEAIIYKDRYYVEFARKTWCLDVFGGRNSGLVVAEVELETATERISLPDWIGEEITASLRYRNSHLAQEPFEQW